MRGVSAAGLAFAAAALLAGGSACQLGGGSASTSPTPSLHPTISGSQTPALDPAVALPAGFPADVPVYPGARLTAAASFGSGAQSTWGMEWETFDAVTKVLAFYGAQLNQGDWKITFSGTANGAYSAVFTRKSNTKVQAILGADGSSGVTKISLALFAG